MSLKDELYDGGISPTEVWKAVADACSHGAVQTAIGTSEKPDEADLSALWKHIANGAACCNEALVNICRRKAEGVIGKSFERTEAGNLELKKSPEYKNWTKAIHQCLRERLTYGAPSPDTGLVMAVLGYDECCRRLGLKP